MKSLGKSEKENPICWGESVSVGEASFWWNAKQAFPQEEEEFKKI